MTDTTGQDLIFLCLLCFLHSLSSSYFLPLFYCLISILLFLYASVWKTLVREFPIFYSHTPVQIGKSTHFWKINIFAKTAEFVIFVQNLWICAVNGEILKNVIKILMQFYIYTLTQWPVNDKPLNTLGMLNCFFPFPKWNLFLFCSNSLKWPFLSCYVPKFIILVYF